MTTEELADDCKIGVTVVKRLLREVFPGEDFRPPGKTLSSHHVRTVQEKLPAFLAMRNSRPQDVVAMRAARPLPLSAEDRPAADRSQSARAPRSGGRHRILLHRDVARFLDDTHAETRQQAGVKRLLREMLVEGRSQRRVKGTRGNNAGWLRAPLGDNGGFHYYLWHALQGQRPVQHMLLERGDVVVRAVHHHDATDRERIDAGTLDDYTPLDARDYVELLEGSGADPLSPPQRSAFASTAFATITNGHPGAGKTTLQFERARRHTGRLLFVTFGASQRDHAVRWFETYAPDGLEVDARTHEEVFRAIDPSWKPPLPPDEGARLLATRLEGEMARLGPWRRHMPALYAELRAHYWGRALPIPFREHAAVVDEASQEKAYVERRTGELGEEAVRSAVRAARALSPSEVERLFGDLVRAREMGEALRSGTALLPIGLSSLDAIIVDEVQDLTLVESLVCVFLAHASAEESGRRPSFHAAGDEGQTVRPTDFVWGEMKDLVTALLGAPEEFKLPGNVRSPRTLTQVINNSWGLYKSVGKSQRPRGYAEAEVDESAVGTVLWVDASTQFEKLLGIIARTPGAALVYPDVAVPLDIRRAAAAAKVPLVLAAPEAKGLDFRVVFVIDVGRKAAVVCSVDPRPEESSVVEIEQRMAVDAIRVAISRSTEVLVFVERAPDDTIRERLQALCSEGDTLLESVVTSVPVDEIETKLDIDTSDRTDLVTQYLSNFDRVFADDVAAALSLASQARQWLGDSNRAGSVQGQLRKDVYRLHGRALFRAAIRSTGSERERRDLFRRSNTDLNLAGEQDLSRLALDARDVLLAEPGTTAIGQSLQRIVALLLPAATAAEQEEAELILRGFVAKLDAAPVNEFQARARLLDALDALLPAEERRPELLVARKSLAVRVAEACLLGEQSPAATRLGARALTLVGDGRPDLSARLADREGHVAQAIDFFRIAGLPAEALRVSRRVGDDPQRSLALAREAGAESTPSLERLARIEADLAGLALGPSSLTDGERERLVKVVREGFAERKRGRS